MLHYTLNRIFHISLSALLLLAVFGCGKDKHHDTMPPAIPTHKICAGDLAFRLGRSIESGVIASDGEFSHIGIVIQSDSTLCVAHIEPSRKGSERVKYEELEEFFHPQRASAGAIMRLKELDSAQYSTLEGYILSCHDIEFDHSYSLSDTTAMYCTELVHHTFSAAGIDLTQGIRHKLPLAAEPVVLPSDIARNKNLYTIWSF